MNGPHGHCKRFPYSKRRHSRRMSVQLNWSTELNEIMPLEMSPTQTSMNYWEIIHGVVRWQLWKGRCTQCMDGMVTTQDSLAAKIWHLVQGVCLNIWLAWSTEPKTIRRCTAGNAVSDILTWGIQSHRLNEEEFSRSHEQLVKHRLQPICEIRCRDKFCFNIRCFEADENCQISNGSM